MKPDQPLLSPSHSSVSMSAIAAAVAFSVVSLSVAPQAEAQFHVREGDKVVPRTEVPTSTQQYAATTPSTSGTAASRSTMASGAEGERRFRTVNGIRDVGWDYNEMIDKADVVWGRAKHHPNGNYTISKVEDATLIQRTFTQPRTAEEHTKTDDERQPVERRVVRLDNAGRPLEVLIYDIRNQLKFRGLLIYDRAGRFREEQLLNPQGQIVRRQVQEYDASGKALPPTTYMDEDALVSDITLVLTGNENVGSEYVPSSGGGQTAGAGAGAEPKKEGSLLKRAGRALMFWKD